jgi:hypothetical protein
VVLNGKLSHKSSSDAITSVDKFLKHNISINAKQIGGAKATLVSHTYPSADKLHPGYIEYLIHCWSTASIAVVSPELLWHLVLSVACERCAGSEEYADAFVRTSNETLQIGSLRGLENRMYELVKTMSIGYTDALFPKFSTATGQSQMARAVAILGSHVKVNPNWERTQFGQGIPALEIRGTDDDWDFLSEGLTYLSRAIPRDDTTFDWFLRVERVLRNAIANHDNPSMWENFFTSKKISGEPWVAGWVTDLALTKESDEYNPPGLMPTGLNAVKVYDKDTQSDYVIVSGISASADKLTDGGVVAEPIFGYCYAALEGGKKKG